ncbi:hypothetical protein COU80_01805 [Candidatus Peregrinibacteria bacterium CG10_big_fil_rev_8_21_14_0_10_55_24]|nr:MAG: hypothetical protein COU80_01805 [Candidatus Peregrinibacteria bacterium CG10_big_fil_rev_8_21_14_0_10_55_24]
MLKIPTTLHGTQELEAKILRVDPLMLQRRLEAAGAILDGHFDIQEQRYFPTPQMREEQLSMRLRKLWDGNEDRVELVLKRKHDPRYVPGYESLGPCIKSRTEYELDLQNTVGCECRFALMKLILEACGVEPRDHITTTRTRYSRGEIRYEIERILSSEERKSPLPAPFLEIEGPTPLAIAEAARAIGYPASALSALTKRDLIEQCAAEGS